MFNRPVFIFQIEINYRIAYRASYGYWCDANTVRNGILQYSDETIQCIEGCSDNSKMNFYCTDFSATEDWSSGANSVTFNLPSSSNNLYTFGYVFAFNEKGGKRGNTIERTN